MGVLTIAVLIFMLYLVFLVLNNFTIRPWQIFVGIISLVIFVRLTTAKKRKPTSNIEISEEKKIHEDPIDQIIRELDEMKIKE